MPFPFGVAIGRKSFVEGIFTRCRGHFGPNRKTGARPLREDAGGLHALHGKREPIPPAVQWNCHGGSATESTYRFVTVTL